MKNCMKNFLLISNIAIFGFLSLPCIHNSIDNHHVYINFLIFNGRMSLISDVISTAILMNLIFTEKILTFLTTLTTVITGFFLDRHI